MRVDRAAMFGGVLLLLAGILASPFPAAPARAQAGAPQAVTTPVATPTGGAAPKADCADPAFDWTEGGGTAETPAVNLRHIFCGQYNRSGKPVGVHSMLIIAGSADVASVGAPTVEWNGLTVRPVTFSNGATSARKSFFPDSCGIDTILRSVRYAAANSAPAGTWFRGPSAPAGGGSGYCLDKTGRPFTIQFAWIGEGRSRINTAFPIVPTS